MGGWRILRNGGGGGLGVRPLYGLGDGGGENRAGNRKRSRKEQKGEHDRKWKQNRKEQIKKK